MLASASNGIFVGTAAVFGTVFAALAFLLDLNPWLAATAALGPTIALNVWAWRDAEMFPISPESARKAARVGWWTGAISLVLGIFS